MLPTSGVQNLATGVLYIVGEFQKRASSDGAHHYDQHQKHECQQKTTHILHYILFCPGPSTLVCAETLRQEGFTGKITLVSRESVLPYDRIKLSKVRKALKEFIVSQY